MSVSSRQSAVGRWARSLPLAVLICLLLWLSAISVQAQTPAPTHDPDLMTQEQILDELKFRRAQNAALSEQVGALKEQIKTLGELAATYKERGDFYKEASTSRAGANVLEAERDRIRREQIEEYKAEVGRLRSENDSLRRSRDRRTLFGLAAGFGACKLSGR